MPELTTRLLVISHDAGGMTERVQAKRRRALPFAEGEDAGAQVFKFKRLDLKTRPRVRVYADSTAVGRTPATTAPR